jgi:hypothetical protein
MSKAAPVLGGIVEGVVASVGKDVDGAVGVPGEFADCAKAVDRPPLTGLG